MVMLKLIAAEPPKAVIIVPGVIPVPCNVWPGYNVPSATAVTVKVVPEMLPVTLAPVVAELKSCCVPIV